MKMSTTVNAPVGGEPVREVESFVYLGNDVDQNRLGKSSFRHAQKHLGIWRNQHENQTQHLQLRCEVSPALRNTDDATKDPDILQHLSEAHLQYLMARADPK